MTRYRVLYGLVSIAVFTSSWDAVRVGSLSLSDIVTLAALVAGLLAVLDGAPIAGIGPIVGWSSVIVAAFLMSITFPAGAAFMDGRIVPPNPLALYGTLNSITPSTTSALLRWFIAFVALPCLIVIAVRSREGIARRVMVTWLLGILVNGLVVIYDDSLGGQVGASLIGFSNVDRSTGLSTAANHIGEALALGAAAAAVLPRRFIVKAAAIAVVITASVDTGSRGGFTVAVLALVLAVATNKAFRPYRATVAIFGPLAVATVLMFFPALLHSILTKTRLLGVTSASTSDSQRGAVAHQAALDFKHSPLHGIGVTVLEQAHSLPLQIAAASGVVGIVGFAGYFATALLGGVRARRDPIAALCLITLLVTLGIGLVENLVTARFQWVEVGVLAALGAEHRRQHPRRRKPVSGERDADRAESPPSEVHPATLASNGRSAWTPAR